METVKQAFWWILIVFISAAGLAFLSNISNVFDTDWATWQIVINSGIIAVVSAVVAYFVPKVKAFGIGSK